jgi:DNA-directed RNA polymerase subunit E'
MGKIGITCRQPFLGALEWVEKEIRRAQGGASGENSSGKNSNADKKGADSSYAKAAKKDKR